MVTNKDSNDKSAVQICDKNLHNGSNSTESMESIESSQVLVRKEETGKPSQFQAIDTIDLFELLRRGLWHW